MPRGEAQRNLARALAGSGIESAQIDARVLLCAALEIEHAELICESASPLGAAGAEALQAFAMRRLRREPVARITGFREFWRSQFQIGPAVLDPRPETEALIEAVLERAKEHPRKAWRILDLGTGSGAILCSLLLSLPGSFGIGVDISPAACETARANVDSLELSQRGLIVCGNWAQALGGRFDLIVSNPPYVASRELRVLAPEVRDYDPRLALDGGEDGLSAYREIIPRLPELLAPGGLAAVEIGARQKSHVEALMQEALGPEVESHLDLGGRWRVVVARRGCPAGA